MGWGGGRREGNYGGFGLVATWNWDVTGASSELGTTLASHNKNRASLSFSV